MQNINNFKNELEKIKENFKSEISGIRSGRATPDLISKILIDCYGAKCPLIETAAINIENARTLRVQPWDKNLIASIEKGIRDSGIGLNPIVDKETLRVSLSELTDERRKQLIKLLHEKLEDARIKSKLRRDEIWKDIQYKEKNGEISEDEKFRKKEELQKIIYKTNEELEEIFAKKEKEIQS